MLLYFDASSPEGTALWRSLPKKKPKQKNQNSSDDIKAEAC